MGRAWQPHESHQPYLLQLKIDFNLSGMGWLRLSSARFRCARIRACYRCMEAALGACLRSTCTLCMSPPSCARTASPWHCPQAAAAGRLHAAAPRLGHPPPGGGK